MDGAREGIRKKKEKRNDVWRGVLGGHCPMWIFADWMHCVGVVQYCVLKFWIIVLVSLRSGFFYELHYSFSFCA